MSHRWTYFFGPGSVEGDPEDKQSIGAKGSGLAAMCKAGLPVPPGFTIAIPCSRYFREHNNTWPVGLEAEVREQLARLESACARKFGGQPPLLLAIRSGATTPMPGMMDSILNCGLNPAAARQDDAGFWRIYLQFMRMFGKTVAGIGAGEFDMVDRELASEQQAEHHKPGEGDLRLRAERYGKLYLLRTDQPFPATPWECLVQSIEAVFHSWNDERAIAYRREHAVQGDGTAVTVQLMFPSEVSGIVFTMNPNRVEANEIVVESAYGLGEAVVSGDVHPDSFTVDRASLAICQRTIGHKLHRIMAYDDGQRAHDPDAPSLADNQVQALARLSLEIERFFHAPMDIEFGYADGSFAILQSRPMRGLDVLDDVEVGRKKELYRLRELAGPRRRVWVAHNLGETLAAPTPLTWDILRRFMSGKGGFGRMYRDLGYRPSAEVCRNGFLELIAGRIYTDSDRAAKLFWAGLPLCYDLDAVVRNPRIMDAAPVTFDPFRTRIWSLATLPVLFGRMLWCSHKLKKLRKAVVPRFEQQILPSYLAWVASKWRQNLGELTTAELCTELRGRVDRVMNEFGGESLKPGFFGGMAAASLTGTLIQLMGQEAGTQLALTLTQGLEGDTTFDLCSSLHDVASGRHSLASFLETYGQRAVEEMELANPRWRENSAYLKRIVTLCQNPSTRAPMELHRRNAERRAAAEQELQETLRHWGGSCLYEDVRMDLADAQRMLPYRESGKHYLMMGYETIRLVILELAARWELDRDIFFLTLDELASYERRRDEMTSVIASRILRWQSARRLELPAVIDSQHLEDFGLPLRHDFARELPGEPLATGVATGLARIVLDPRKADAPLVDSVLVCPVIDPGWTPLFLHARAVIVERGNTLSHGAIVARDFGIPAVVCPDATRRIPDRTLIRVDGNRGLVTVVGGGPPS